MLNVYLGFWYTSPWLFLQLPRQIDVGEEDKYVKNLAWELYICSFWRYVVNCKKFLAQYYNYVSALFWEDLGLSSNLRRYFDWNMLWLRCCRCEAVATERWLKSGGYRTVAVKRWKTMLILSCINIELCDVRRLLSSWAPMCSSYW